MNETFAAPASGDTSFPGNEETAHERLEVPAEALAETILPVGVGVRQDFEIPLDARGDLSPIKGDPWIARLKERALVGEKGEVGRPEDGSRLLERRAPRDDLAPDPQLSPDVRLWALLQSASGGTWGGCVFDVDRLEKILRGR